MGKVSYQCLPEAQRCRVSPPCQPSTDSKARVTKSLLCCVTYRDTDWVYTNWSGRGCRSGMAAVARAARSRIAAADTGGLVRRACEDGAPARTLGSTIAALAAVRNCASLIRSRTSSATTSVADVKWVTPRTYRLWRDTGLLGYPRSCCTTTASCCGRGSGLARFSRDTPGSSPDDRCGCGLRCWELLHLLGIPALRDAAGVDRVEYLGVERRRWMFRRRLSRDGWWLIRCGSGGSVGG
jgi:hypothetical protein